MEIDEKLMNLAREVKDFPKLEVCGPMPGEKTTVLRVDNDCLSEEGKKLLGVTKEEPDPMEEVNRRLAEAGRALSWGLSGAVEAIGLWGRTILAPTMEEFGRECRKLAESFGKYGLGSIALELLRRMEEERALIEKAKGYGLDGRVISLCEHRKERVRKKNLNRLRKGVLRYERSRRNTRGQEAGEPTEGHAGDCQPDEPVPGEAGGTESNG